MPEFSKNEFDLSSEHEDVPDLEGTESSISILDSVEEALSQIPVDLDVPEGNVLADDSDGSHAAEKTQVNIVKELTQATVQNVIEGAASHSGLISVIDGDNEQRKAQKRNLLTNFLAYVGTATNTGVNEDREGFSRTLGNLFRNFEQASSALARFRKTEAKQMQKEYESVIAEVWRRMDYVRERMDFVGENFTRVRILTAITTLVPFMVAGELRKSFDHSHHVLWWLRRTSRLDIENRRGEIKGTPLDEGLRSEQSSFPLAFEIEPTDVSTILCKKLQRFAANKHEYKLDQDSAPNAHDANTARVLVWFGRSPQYIDVPLEWFEKSEDLPAAKQRLQALLEQAEAAPRIERSLEEMNQLRRECYGKFADQGDQTKKILNADIALVMGGSDISNPSEVMGSRTFVTGGARIRETLYVSGFAEKTSVTSKVTQVVNKFAHTWGDGKLAVKWIEQDFANLEALESVTPQASEVPLQSSLEGKVFGLPEEPYRGSSLTEVARPAEYIGFAEASREQSQFWIDAVSALRMVLSSEEERTGRKDSKSGPSKPFGLAKLTLADIFNKAHKLASRTQSSHYLESREDAVLPTEEGPKKVEVLDVAFDVLPHEFIAVFEAFVRRYRQEAQAGNVGKEAWTHEQWKKMTLYEQSSVEFQTVLEKLPTGLRQFIEEKVRAKNSDSLASFMSTLSGSIKQVEKIVRVVSQQQLTVGELVTQAVANPRGGLISVLANVRELPKQGDGVVKWRWFGSANTDSFQPNDPGEEFENWGGVLGVTNVPDGGYAFLTRKLENQVLQPRVRNMAEDRLVQLLREPAPAMPGGMLAVTNLVGLSFSQVEERLRSYDNPVSAQDRELKQKGEYFKKVGADAPPVNDRLVAEALRAHVFQEYWQKVQDPEWRKQDTQEQVDETILAVEFLLRMLAPNVPLEKFVDAYRKLKDAKLATTENVMRIFQAFQAEA